MADDRYKWLDSEAAERLLRGLPVSARSAAGNEPGEPDDSRGRSRTQPPAPADGGSGEGDSGEDRRSARLAAALSGIVAENTHLSGGHGAAELAGEAAAVNAFRAAHVKMPGSVTLGLPDAVHSTDDAADRRCGGRRRPSLRGRPLRAGVVTALAGCALGGVAVAAGTGVLPTPFGGNTPVTKVSPANSRGAGSGGAQGGSDLQASPGGSESADPGNDGKRGKGDGKNGAGDSVSPGGSPGDSRTSPPASSEDAGRQARERNKRLARLSCVAYEKDELAADDRRKFERLAGGPREVKLFCAQHGVVVSEVSGGQGGVDGGADLDSDSGGGSEGSDADGDSGGTGRDSGGTTDGSTTDGSDGNTGETTAESTGGAGSTASVGDGASTSPDVSPSAAASTANDL